MNAEKKQWPGGGRFREAIPKSFKPTIVFIHQYGGNADTSHRHQDMVLDMGYNCFSFRLTPRIRDAGIEGWAEELREVLDAIEGPKIIYSFSFPSVSVPALLGTRPRKDVRAWICDGGPFSEIWQCYWNLLTFLKVGNVVSRFVGTFANYVSAGGPFYDNKVAKWLAGMNPGLPIFSIRTGADILVPVRAIERFFSLGPPTLNIQTLLIPNIGHLEGLQKAENVYKSAVENFLKSVT